MSAGRVIGHHTHAGLPNGGGAQWRSPSDLTKEDAMLRKITTTPGRPVRARPPDGGGFARPNPQPDGLRPPVSFYRKGAVIL